MLCSICNQQTNNVTINGSLTLCPACENRLNHAAPSLLRCCERAADLLGRLNTPDAPTWAEVATTLGRLLATVATARGTAAVEAVETEAESWPDTSPGLLMAERKPRPETPSRFTFWRELGDPDDWHTWPVSGSEEP